MNVVAKNILRLRVELADAVDAAMTTPSTRVVVIVGAGGSFCSGGDLSTMADVTPEGARARTADAIRVPRAIRGGDKPVIAAVEGSAYGAGLSLALVCDRVVAARDSRFNAAFTRVGLAADMGITVTLPERIGVRVPVDGLRCRARPRGRGADRPAHLRRPGRRRGGLPGASPAPVRRPLVMGVMTA